MILGRVHKSFLSLAIGTSVVVFLFWAAIYAIRLGGNQNVPSQIALMRSYIAFGGAASTTDDQLQASVADTGAIPALNLNYAGMPA